MNPIRVFLVDDSAVVRQVLQAALTQDPGIEVVGSAQDPLFAWQRIEGNWPDVLILGQGPRPGLMHGGESLGTVVAHARHDDPPGIAPAQFSDGAKEHIHRWTMVFDQWAVEDLDLKLCPGPG